MTDRPAWKGPERRTNQRLRALIDDLQARVRHNQLAVSSRDGAAVFEILRVDDAEPLGTTFCSTVTSSAKPLPEQKSRSSGNFTTVNCGSNRFRWHCSDRGVRFDIVVDNSYDGPDRVVGEDIRHGAVTNAAGKRALYIANPRGATGTFFTVSVEPLSE